jgi:chemotaxis protein CheZ
VKSTQEKLGNSMLKNLIQLREQKGQILIEDVGALLEGMASGLQDGNDTDNFLKSEIENMASYIVNAKSEISAMIPADEDDANNNINRATMELDEVVKATEEATNSIMDAADAIQGLAGGLDDKSAGQQIVDETMKVYDACSFQDITGQRINKVLRTIEEIEGRVVKLVTLFGGELPEGYVPKDIPERVERPDEALMDGPQLAGEKPSQDDIDKLFDSM